MRLFILNRGKAFEKKDIVKRSRLSVAAVGRELRMLDAAGFIKKRGTAWVFDQSFKYAEEFERVLAGPNIFNEKTITDNLRNVGRLKLLVASGFFTDTKDSHLDILAVGDRLNKKRIEEGVRKIEAEIGKELNYAVFDMKEFMYRLAMYDKLVRDVLDFPHQVILQSKELSTQSLKRP